MSEHELEPIRGLPERPPQGEHILWQGEPCWRSLSRRLFHVRLIAVYFAVLMVWRGAVTVADGATLAEAALSAAVLLPVLAAAIALVAVLAWLIARTTVYTITNRRLVMRFGVALPMTINIPFTAIDEAMLKSFPDGSGNIAVTPSQDQRVSYIVLWPHARPWRVGRPEPTLRSIPEAPRVAKILADALTAAREQAGEQPRQAGATTDQPRRAAPVVEPSSLVSAA